MIYSYSDEWMLFFIASKQNCGKSDMIVVTFSALHRRHMKQVWLTFCRNFWRPIFTKVCCRYALTRSFPICWQQSVWSSLTINWVTWSLMSIIIGWSWYRGINEYLCLPLACKIPYSSKNGLNRRNESIRSISCPICIVLNLFWCEIYIRGFWASFWLPVVFFTQNVCCFVEGCCVLGSRFQI